VGKEASNLPVNLLQRIHLLRRSRSGAPLAIHISPSPWSEHSHATCRSGETIISLNLPFLLLQTSHASSTPMPPPSTPLRRSPAPTASYHPSRLILRLIPPPSPLLTPLSSLESTSYLSPLSRRLLSRRPDHLQPLRVLPQPEPGSRLFLLKRQREARASLLPFQPTHHLHWSLRIRTLTSQWMGADGRLGQVFLITGSSFMARKLMDETAQLA
jgi:hypothetical protein